MQKARELLGWEAQVPLRDGLADTVAWLREQQRAPLIRLAGTTRHHIGTRLHDRTKLAELARASAACAGARTVSFHEPWRVQLPLSDAPARGRRTTHPGNKGLKADALGYISNLVIAIASTAPAYSLAATLGFIVAVGGVGVHAPAVLIVSFIPILFVSVGYRFFNLADPDAGTTFAWVTRTFGPQLGWINGWAIFLADIIVMASLAAIASNYTFLLFGSHRRDRRTSALIVGSVRVDRADDLDLLPRHRAVGAGPDDPARPRDLHAGAVRGRRAGQGLRQQPGALDSRVGVVVQPVRPRAGAR